MSAFFHSISVVVCSLVLLVAYLCVTTINGFSIHHHHHHHHRLYHDGIFPKHRLETTASTCTTVKNHWNVQKQVPTGWLTLTFAPLRALKIEQEEDFLSSLSPIHHSTTSIDQDVSLLDTTGISNLLVVGDGDLSYGASIAKSLAESNVLLIATVLENREQHQQVYQRSKSNEEQILSFGGQVLFGIDATRLQDFFPSNDHEENVTTFDRIQFNFPHWRGKANHRYNRQLINGFLQSASAKLAPTGEIHMALVQGQGGSSAKTLKEYRDTWTPIMYAAEHGLLLYKIQPFQATYNLSAHRGVDRGFKLGKEPKLFVFAKPERLQGTAIDKRYQLCCWHELHILLPSGDDDKGEDGGGLSSSEYQLEDIVEGNGIQVMIQKIVPQGIRVEVPARAIQDKSETGKETDMAVFFVVYCGESTVLRREDADKCRQLAEEQVLKHIPLREDRRGRLISKPFPYYLLESVVEGHSFPKPPRNKMEHP